MDPHRSTYQTWNTETERRVLPQSYFQIGIHELSFSSEKLKNFSVKLALNNSPVTPASLELAYHVCRSPFFLLFLTIAPIVKKY